MKIIFKVLFIVAVFIMSMMIGVTIGSYAYDKYMENKDVQEVKPLVINTNPNEVKHIIVYDSSGELIYECEGSMNMDYKGTMVIFRVQE